MYIELSKDLEQELINFYLMPHTIAETMKKYSVGREKIKNILKAHNIPEHSKEIVNTIKQNNFTSEQVQEIIKFYLMPNTLQDTAEKFNIGRFALKNLLKRNNIVEHSRKILELLKFNRLINGREQEIIEFYLQPNSIEKTAIAFNLGRPAVISLLSKNNIEIRDDSRKIIFTEEQEKEIINFYLVPNSLRETSQYFNIKNRDVIKNILIKYDIPFHSQEVCMQLKQQKAIKTNLEKYGVTNTYQLPEIREKAQKTWKDNEQEIRKKMQQTSLERHGDPFYHNQEQANKTRLEKYGVINFFQIKEIHEKALERNHSPEVLEKKRQTCLERLGTETPLNNKICREKGLKTLYSKYGIYHAPKYLYICNNLHFDSFPELCIYLYCINNNINIEREPIELKYIYNNKEYSYYPDFKINNELIEIKGNQFLKEDDTWQNPYNHSLDELYEAKHQCALQNNVKILYSEDYQKYVDWFNANYNIEDFKNEKTEK